MSHWKTLFDYDHFGCHDIPEQEPREVVVVITKIERREIKTKNGKEIAAIADLIGVGKPMIFNKTNADILAGLIGSEDYEKFLNIPLILFPARVRGPRGGMVWGLRFKPELAKTNPLPVLDPNSPKWNEAKAALKAGTAKIEAIRKAYYISPQNQTLILA